MAAQIKSFDLIKQNKMFEGIPSVDLKFKVSHDNYIEKREGDIIFQAGDPGNSIYLILEGEVKIKTPSLSGARVEKRQANNFIGESEFLEGMARISSAVAEKNCTLLQLTKDEMDSLTSGHPEILVNLKIGGAASKPSDSLPNDAPMEVEPLPFAEPDLNETPAKPEAENFEQLPPDENSNEKDEEGYEAVVGFKKSSPELNDLDSAPEPPSAFDESAIANSWAEDFEEKQEQPKKINEFETDTDLLSKEVTEANELVTDDNSLNNEEIIDEATMQAETENQVFEQTLQDDGANEIMTDEQEPEITTDFNFASFKTIDNSKIITDIKPLPEEEEEPLSDEEKASLASWDFSLYPAEEENELIQPEPMPDTINEKNSELDIVDIPLEDKNDLPNDEPAIAGEAEIQSGTESLAQKMEETESHQEESIADEEKALGAEPSVQAVEEKEPLSDVENQSVSDMNVADKPEEEIKENPAEEEIIDEDFITAFGEMPLGFEHIPEDLISEKLISEVDPKEIDALPTAGFDELEEITSFEIPEEITKKLESDIANGDLKNDEPDLVADDTAAITMPEGEMPVFEAVIPDEIKDLINDEAETLEEAVKPDNITAGTEEPAIPDIPMDILPEMPLDVLPETETKESILPEIPDIALSEISQETIPESTEEILPEIPQDAPAVPNEEIMPEIPDDILTELPEPDISEISSEIPQVITEEIIPGLPADILTELPELGMQEIADTVNKEAVSESYAEITPEIAKEIIAETPEKIISEAAVNIEYDAVPVEQKTNFSGFTQEQLHLIIQAAQKVNSNIELENVLNAIVEAACELTDADRGTLYLVDEENKELWSKIGFGLESKEIKLKIGDGLAGASAESGEIINIADAAQDNRFNSGFDMATGYTTKSVICFPIKNRDGVVKGVLQLLNNKNGSFSELEEQFLEALSVHAAIALENASLVEQLLAKDRINTLGKMAGFILQDIKKPVMTVKHFAEYIKKKQVPADVNQALDMLIEQASSAITLVQTTLNYTEGKTQIQTKSQSINQALDHILLMLAEFVEERKVKLFKKYDKDVLVFLDKEEFYQACYQLTKNACNAMPDGGNLYFVTKISGDSVEISIRDTGLGIPESIKERIFEPFMSQGKKPGVGLGLAIVEKIIKDHNGSISVDSVLGEGATFTLKLPLVVKH